MMGWKMGKLDGGEGVEWADWNGAKVDWTVIVGRGQQCYVLGWG